MERRSPVIPFHLAVSKWSGGGVEQWLEERSPVGCPRCGPTRGQHEKKRKQEINSVFDRVSCPREFCKYVPAWLGFRPPSQAWFDQLVGRAGSVQ